MSRQFLAVHEWGQGITMSAVFGKSVKPASRPTLQICAMLAEFAVIAEAACDMLPGTPRKSGLLRRRRPWPRIKALFTKLTMARSRLWAPGRQISAAVDRYRFHTRSKP
jgi:hypothetical protein